jgi:hypothetical protein
VSSAAAENSAIIASAQIVIEKSLFITQYLMRIDY